MNEFDLISHVCSLNPTLGSRVVLPPGDDLGGLQIGAGTIILAGVDQVIGGVHLPVEASPERYARKVIRRSLSDVAAMAAVPAGALVTAALPPGLADDWGHRFADALNREAAVYDCPVFGGDVAAVSSSNTPPLVTATVLASPDHLMGDRFVRRSGARPGDAVWVSGSLGGSLLPDGSGHHESFEPRIALGRALHRLLGDSLHSMIDVSDGLVSDAGHLASQSGVQITLEVESLPRRGASTALEALSDGEDYELCFTVDRSAEVPDQLEAIALTRIGTVQSGAEVVVREEGAVVDFSERGWEHRT